MRRAPATLIALVLALAVSVTTCRLDKLINPATADRLLVDRDSVLASAHVGSVDAVTTTVRIASADGLALKWTASKTAAWVTLDADSGSAPDSLVVRLHSDTLSKTLHRDTIVFTSLQSVVTVKVPIAFDMLDSAAQLVVSPPDRDTAAFRNASAFLGTAQPDTFSLRIKNKGALPLTWTATFNATWVTLSDSGGTVPAKDTTSTVVLVTLRPDTLGTGPHNARIIFAAPGAIGAPDTVPITYMINPCAETGITLDTIKASSITLSDCGAPKKAGSQAKLYAVQVNTGDTLSVRLTSAAFDPFLVITNAAGDSVAGNDECGVEVGPACIKYIVPNTGRYVIEATTAVGATTGAFTLLAVRERTPMAPAAGQFRLNGTTTIGVGTITPESTVVFKAMLNDPNPFDSVRLEVDVVGLASGLVSDSSAFVPRGTSVALPVTGLHDNEGYHWRARTCDKSGRCSTWFDFGGNIDPAVDFIVNSRPQDPTIGALTQVGPSGPMPVGGGTGGTYPNSVTVTFKAGVTDLDPGDLIWIEEEYKKVGMAFDSATTHGSGVASGDTAVVSVSIAVQLLNLQADYHWRARVCDQTGRCSVWVGFGGNSDVVTAATDFHVP